RVLIRTRRDADETCEHALEVIRAGVHKPRQTRERDRCVRVLLDERTGLANLVHTEWCLDLPRRSLAKAGLPRRSVAKAGGGSSTHGTQDTGRTTVCSIRSLRGKSLVRGASQGAP